MQNSHTKERILALTPAFQSLVNELLQCGYDNGNNPQVSCGIRTGVEQQKLYEQGRTQPGKIITNAQAGQSLHQYGIAIDVFFLVDGKVNYNEDLFQLLWELACKKRLDKKGLVWSGNWQGKLKERAHFQLGNPDWRELMKASKLNG